MATAAYLVDNFAYNAPARLTVCPAQLDFKYNPVQALIAPHAQLDVIFAVAHHAFNVLTIINWYLAIV